MYYELYVEISNICNKLFYFQDLLEDFLERQKRRRADYKEIDPKCLNWRPYVPPPPSEEPQSNSNKNKSNKAAADRKKSLAAGVSQ